MKANRKSLALDAALFASFFAVWFLLLQIVEPELRDEACAPEAQKSLTTD